MLRKEKRKRERSPKRRFVTLATLLLTAAVAAVVAWYSWPSSEPLANVIAGDGSNTIRRVTAQPHELTNVPPAEIFGIGKWPAARDATDPVAVRPFQVGDFLFYRIGRAQMRPAGYGWFEDGNKFWWANRHGTIRTATFPDLQPLRELSFEGLKIHDIRKNPYLEKQEPWRKVQRELQELDFRGAVSVGDRIFAMFGSAGYRQTNLIEIELPSLNVTGAKGFPGFYYDLLDPQDGRSLVMKGDSTLGFLEVGDRQMHAFGLGEHRAIRHDAGGLAVCIRENETYTLDRTDSVISGERRPNTVTYLGSKDREQGALAIEVDEYTGTARIRDGDRLLGFADGFSIIGFRFHPQKHLGLGAISGIATRTPGFGLMLLAPDAMSEATKKEWQARQPAVAAESELPEIEIQRETPKIQSEMPEHEDFQITKMLLDESGFSGAVGAWIVEGTKIYFDVVDEDESVLGCLNLDDLSLDWLIDGGQLGATTDNYLVARLQGRFLALDKQNLDVVRDLGLGGDSRFAAGHFKDLLIVDRFDGLNSPAVLDVASGQRLMHHARYNSASSAGQLNREDPRWFGGQSPEIPRRFAGLTVVPASGTGKLLELAPSGDWVYSRFGLLQMEWPRVRHSEFPDLPRYRDTPGPEFSPQQFTRDSRFAMFVDYRKRAPDNQFVALVRQLDDPDESRIELATEFPQVWMDQNPQTGNYWVRVQAPAPEGSFEDPPMRMIEFTADGTRLRELPDFSDAPQQRQFLPDGRLICKSRKGFQIVTIGDSDKE